MKIKLASAILLTALVAATVALSVAETNSSHPETLHVRGPGDLLEAVRGSVSAPSSDLSASSSVRGVNERPVDSNFHSDPARAVSWKNIDLSEVVRPVARRLSEKAQEELLASTSTSSSPPERAHIIESPSTPEGHYYARFQDGSVYLIPATKRGWQYRSLEGIAPFDKLEVDRLDKQYKRTTNPEWAARERKSKQRRRQEAKAAASVKNAELENSGSGMPTPSKPPKRVAVRSGPTDENGFFPVTFSNGQTFLIPPKMRNLKRQYNALNLQQKGELIALEKKEYTVEYRRKARQAGQDAPAPVPHSPQDHFEHDNTSSANSSSHQTPSQASNIPWSPTFDGLEDIVSL